MKTDEQIIGENVKRLRHGTSQEELAGRMRTAGFPWMKMTVYNIEKGERQLKLSEAKTLLDILGYEPTRDMNLLFSSEIDAKAGQLVNQINSAGTQVISCGRTLHEAIVKAQKFLSENRDAEQPEVETLQMFLDYVCGEFFRYLNGVIYSDYVPRVLKHEVEEWKNSGLDKADNSIPSFLEQLPKPNDGD
ncbi:MULTISPECIES: helix-turn-helix domain-containing protein [unclassified Bifidobacterium]|uniref:helix-turn-helix domain-containing protein n=1 Tax=unclassified Bifidobacterium TaxID=2608897 RepID=UPI003F8E0C00